MIWCFRRQCGHRVELDLKEKEEVPCPECHANGEYDVNMIKQDLEWMKHINPDFLR